MELHQRGSQYIAKSPVYNNSLFCSVCKTGKAKKGGNNFYFLLWRRLRKLGKNSYLPKTESIFLSTTRKEMVAIFEFESWHVSGNYHGHLGPCGVSKAKNAPCFLLHLMMASTPSMNYCRAQWWLCYWNIASTSSRNFNIALWPHFNIAENRLRTR